VTVKFGTKLKACRIPPASKPGDKSVVALENDEILAADLLVGLNGV
jgi:hypothetical protein